MRGPRPGRTPTLSGVEAVPDPVEQVRTWLGGHLRHFFTGRSTPGPAFGRPEGDDGLFGPGSVTWRVHADRSMLIGGLRALLLQTLHPLAMAGVAEHSDYRRDPGRRLHRTAAFVMVTTYGSTAEAEAAIEAVQRVHEQIRGVTPDGVPYRATDPALLAWVHATEVDSFARAYQRHGQGRLSSADLDCYVAEMAEVAERIGVLDAPRSWAALQGYLHDVRAELRVTPEARQGVCFLLAPPIPLAAKPAYGIVAAAAVALLPRFARRELWLPVPPLVEPVAVRPATAVLLGVVGWALGPPAARAAAAAS
ncbi:MAG: DUF2236 domain-containing protein [Acidimicrobiia bacterium]|nr:DUF2236 domain-containing protein [Acidimicrobiia bacterium]